jgi:hypothetical protein
MLQRFFLACGYKKIRLDAGFLDSRTEEDNLMHLISELRGESRTISMKTLEFIEYRPSFTRRAKLFALDANLQGEHV